MKSTQKINPDLVRQQVIAGWSYSEIARFHSASPQAVSQYIKRQAPHAVALQSFKDQRADAFATFQHKCLQVQSKILDELLQDGFLSSLTAPNKSSLLLALNACAGTSYDKERLERGKSSQNIEVLTSLIATAHTELFKSASKSISKSTSILSDHPTVPTQAPTEIDVFPTSSHLPTTT